MSNPISIVAFAGPAGSGKDTAGRILIEKLGFVKLSFAAPLKTMLSSIGYPEPLTQDEKERIIPELGVSWRLLAQTLGTEWGRREVNPDIWVILAEKFIRSTGGKFVITDLRFENEAAMVRRLNGVIAHLEGRAHEMTGETKKHVSEKGIERHSHDIVIDNAPIYKGTQSSAEASMKRLTEQVLSAARYVGVQ